MNRYEANKEILRTLEALVEAYPDQRFGQLVTNYIFPDYRERDPFFEESAETLRKLKGE